MSFVRLSILACGMALLVAAIPSRSDAQSQESDTAQATDSIPAEAPPDTIVYDPGNELSRFAPVDTAIDFEAQRTQNPTLALFKSMLVPGLGQIGNGKYLKAAIFFGLDVWVISSALDYRDQASNVRDEFESVTGDDADAIQRRRALYDIFQEKRDQRNKYTWFAVIVTFVSMFDAYADAHLSGFPLKDEENMNVSVEPQRRDDLVMASIRLTF